MRPEVLPFPEGTVAMFTWVFYGMRPRMDDRLKILDLTPIQFMVLGSLRQSGGLSAAELSRHFGVTYQTMGEIVKKLKRRSFITRARSIPGRRGFRLGLTRVGREALRTGERAIEVLENEVFSEMPAQDRETLCELLLRLHDRLGLQCDLDGAAIQTTWSAPSE